MISGYGTRGYDIELMMNTAGLIAPTPAANEDASGPAPPQEERPA
jgi:hypothetical protein